MPPRDRSVTWSEKFRDLDNTATACSIFERGRRGESLSSALGAEFEAAQLAAEARALGADLFEHAQRISQETVDAVAATLFALDHSSRGRLPGEMAAEYARQMMAAAAMRHRQQITP